MTTFFPPVAARPRLRICFSHKPCANRAWVTRRINEVLRIISKTFTFACPCPDGAFVDVLFTEFGCGRDLTVAEIDVTPFSQDEISAMMRYFSSNENLCVVYTR